MDADVMMCATRAGAQGQTGRQIVSCERLTMLDVCVCVYVFVCGWSACVMVMIVCVEASKQLVYSTQFIHNNNIR